MKSMTLRSRLITYHMTLVASLFGYYILCEANKKVKIADDALLTLASSRTLNLEPMRKLEHVLTFLNSLLALYLFKNILVNSIDDRV